MGYVEPASSPTPDDTPRAAQPTAPDVAATKADAAGAVPAGGVAGADDAARDPAGAAAATLVDPEAGGSAGTGTPRLAPKEARRPRDMIISLAVLLIPIALLMGFYRVVLEGDRPVSTDPTSSIELASREFPVAQPAGLTEDQDWHVTSANFRRENGGATLRLGYVPPSDKAILMIQSTVDPSMLVPAEVGEEGRRTGTFRTDQRTWLQYDGRPGETALIATEQTRTIVIIGDRGDTENLERLASALP